MPSAGPGGVRIGYMSPTISTEPVQLAADEGGVFRVGGTRVSFDSLLFAFKDGSTPEEIAQQYPSLDLADVYACIAYYLQHQSEVEAYLEERLARRGEVRGEVEARFDPQGVRDRLLARRKGSA